MIPCILIKYCRCLSPPTQVFLLSFSSPIGVVVSSLVFLPSPTIAMSRERGKRKCIPTYYNFMARRLHLGPSSAPVLPPSSVAAPPLENLPIIDQNWVGCESTQVFVEEEHPLVPPQEPLDSCLFSALYLQASPFHLAHQSDVKPTSSMETCPVEQEIPPTFHDERIQVETQPRIEPQPIVDSAPESPRSCCFS
jgi:hypothetical protein